ncbi:MAG TPA: GNAT family N-acetyltransferase [Gaiellaceae bacterium]
MPGVPPALDITAAETDADLEAMVVVRRAIDPRTTMRLANLRHALETDTRGLSFVVARLRDEPVASGFVHPGHEAIAYGDISVIPSHRGHGVGSAMLAWESDLARSLGKQQLQFEVRQSDVHSRGFLERRGYVRVGSEEAVTLELGGEALSPDVPDGIRLVTLEERPDVVEAMYEVFAEAEQDIPGEDIGTSYEDWRSLNVDRPTRDPAFSFVALAGDEVVGFAQLDVFETEARHGFTAVKRAWRRRGIARALKRAQIAAATDRGLDRLITQSEERNLPMRTLNEQLGYRPDPERSIDELRGPLLPPS